MRTWQISEAPQHGDWRDGMLSLAAELAKPEHEGIADAAVAYALNAMTVTRPVEVPTSQVLSILLKTGDWGPLVLLSRAAPSEETPAALVAAAIVAVTACERTTAFGTDREEDAQVVQAMLGSFVAAGVMQSTTRDRLVALMTRDFPVWDPPVTAGDVFMARSLADG